jgi:hypothetical protein
LEQKTYHSNVSLVGFCNSLENFLRFVVRNEKGRQNNNHRENQKNCSISTVYMLTFKN